MPKILVVDDQPMSLARLRQAAEGYDVIEASGASDAIRKLSLANVDVVVTDLRMEREDAGFDVLNAADPDVPVIVVTVHPDVYDSRRAMEDGAFDFIDRDAAGIDPLFMLKHKIARAVEFRKARLASRHVAP